MTLTTTKCWTTSYAEEVIQGNIIASEKVKLACERHQNDLKKQENDDFPYRFDEEKALRPIGFIEKYCRPSQGEYKRIELQPWQHFVIGSLYGWVHKETGYRRFREGLIFIGRKNGKTTLVSGLSLYACAKDGENGARVYQLANSKEQAREMFEECKAMVEKSPILDKHFHSRLHEIRYKKTISKIQPLASDSKKLDGKNCSFGAFDEIHEYKDYKLINVIKNSTGARKQPLIVYISTAGSQLDGPLMDYYEKAEDVLQGVIEAERTFYYMAELDEGDDIEDTSTWIKANPNMGVTIDPTEMIQEWHERKHIPGERNDFINKRLNIFTKSDEQSFVDFEIIKRNKDVMDLSELEGRACVAGFDLSDSEDFTSVCLEFPLDDGRVFVLSHSFIPEKKVMLDNEKIPYREYVREGHLTVCPGEYVDYSYLYDWIMEQSKRYAIELITYDPANAFRLVKELEGYGFLTESVRQGHKTLNPAMKDIKNLLLDGKVVYNNNRLFRWYLNNVRLVKDRNNNWMPTKQGKYRKIDGFAAWLNAHTEVMKRMVESSGGELEFVSIDDILR
ncbi:terminase large subunit [Mechercharimyces sp. CAU 1602]|uniref:terminase large subunit n=1 Tax=Mechercharimyces sp. CAU 1602 TaxID=2973933 RepID=UPI002162F33C|nr:terminase large subunit [Mechercharimyces sp. CAU 1602]